MKVTAMSEGSSSFPPIASYGFIALFFSTQASTVVAGSTGIVRNGQN